MNPKNFILTSYVEFFNSRYPELAGETVEYSISEITPVDHNDREQIIRSLGGFIGEFETRQKAEKYLAAMLLGKSTSEKKSESSRENGKKGGRPKNYTVQHVGYPTTNVTPEMWKTYSTHATESAAWKRIQKATAHLDYGQWDDHYRVIDPDGNICSKDLFYAKVNQKLIEKEWEKIDNNLSR